MSFLFPAFLAGAIAITVPIVLHLLRKQQAPELEFPAVQFIERRAVERSKRHRLRDLILLALRVGALTLLAVAFARPYFVDASVGSMREGSVVAVDLSFSMGGASRLAELRQRALEALERAPVDAGVAVVTFDDGARVAAPLSRDRAAARSVIEGLEPGYGATNFRAMLAASADVLAGRPGRVIVVSDLQRRGWVDETGVLPPNVTLEAMPVRAATTNLAVAGATVEQGRVRAAVVNHGSGRKTTEVVLAVGDRTLAAKTVTLDPGRPQDVVFDGPVPERGLAKVSVADPDGVPADDDRFVLLDPVAPMKVAVVSGDTARGRHAFFVERALDVAAPAGPVAVRVLPGVEVQELDDGALAEQDVMFALGTRGIDRRTRDRLDAWLARGGGLLVTAGPLSDPASFGSWLDGAVDARPPMAEDVTDAALTPIDVRHPVFQAFGTLTGVLGQARFQRVLRVEAGTGVVVLARFTTGTPALLERRVGAGRILLFASDLGGDWNDFPRKASFLPFLHEVVRYLGQGRPATRELLVADAPAASGRRPGMAQTAGGEPVVVNVDARESDPTVESAAEFVAHVEQGPPPAARGGVQEVMRYEEEQGLWRYGLVIAALFLVTEALLGRVWA